jgi:hypothetical protein
MIINFRACEINRGACKLVSTPMLIIIIKIKPKKDKKKGVKLKGKQKK